jgi:hypothetical protein
MSKDNRAVLSGASGRLVAIAHRVKARKVGDVLAEALPTRVLVVDGDGSRHNYDLKTEADELAFVTGTYVTEWRKEGEEKTPSAFDGLRAGDIVLMTLGGSGDPLAYAISRQGEKVGFSLHRMPPWALKALRGEKPADQKKRDASELETLLSAFKDKSAPFYLSDAADRERMMVSVCYQAFKEAQVVRMGQMSRFRQSAIGRVFMGSEGLFEDGVSKLQLLLLKFSEGVSQIFGKKTKYVAVLEALVSAEAASKRELEEAVEASRLWQLFEPVPGIGPSIAGALIASIGDMRKFPTEAKFWAFCGLHTLKSDGKKFEPGEQPLGGIMARRRTGQLSNWQPKARQALYLLADQFNRRPGSYWGQKLIENKKAYRLKHPEAVKNEAGKLRYNDGHIHKMALWKTLRQFTRWLYREWTRLENDPNYVVKQPELKASPDREDGQDGQKLAA